MSLKFYHRYPSQSLTFTFICIWWARPICFDSVNEKQLKSVRWFTPPSHLDDDPHGVRSRLSSSSASANVTWPRCPSPDHRYKCGLYGVPRYARWRFHVHLPGLTIFFRHANHPSICCRTCNTYTKFMLAIVIPDLRDLSARHPSAAHFWSWVTHWAIVFCDAVQSGSLPVAY